MATPEPNDELKMPERLVQALRDDASRPVLVTSERDVAVLAAANRELRGRFLRARWQKRAIWAAAAAFVLGAIVWSLLYENKSHRNATTTSAGIGTISTDLDGNGRVDIFDAFLVARGLRDGRTEPAWDVNRDGVVDARDVTWLSRAAVQLDGGKGR